MKSIFTLSALFSSILLTNLAFASPCDGTINTFYNALGENKTIRIENVTYKEGSGRHIHDLDEIKNGKDLSSEMHSTKGSHGHAKLEFNAVAYEQDDSGNEISKDSVHIKLHAEKVEYVLKGTGCSLSYKVSKPLLLNKAIDISTINSGTTKKNTAKFQVIFGG